MTRRSRRFVLISGAVLTLPLLLLVLLYVVLFGRSTASDIVNFHPSSFYVQADENFFYTVGDTLKYSNRINPQAPSLASGQIKNYLVAPNRKMIAIVSNGALSVVGDKFQLRRIVSVDSIYGNLNPLGGRSFAIATSSGQETRRIFF